MKAINASGIAPAVGPYCHATIVDGMVYCSGNVGIDEEAKLVSADVASQTKQALANLEKVLKAAGTSMDQVAKTTVFLTDMAHYPVVNEAYAAAFGPHKPARSCVAVASLPLGALVEVEAIAELSD